MKAVFDMTIVNSVCNEVGAFGYWGKHRSTSITEIKNLKSFGIDGAFGFPLNLCKISAKIKKGQ